MEAWMNDVPQAIVQTQRALRASVPDLQVGTTPRLRVIDAQMQIANENPARTIGLLLGPGSAPAAFGVGAFRGFFR